MAALSETATVGMVKCAQSAHIHVNFVFCVK